jgi:hypothetical protein
MERSCIGPEKGEDYIDKKQNYLVAIVNQLKG